MISTKSVTKLYESVPIVQQIIENRDLTSKEASKSLGRAGYLVGESTIRRLRNKIFGNSTAEDFKSCSKYRAEGPKNPESPTTSGTFTESHEKTADTWNISLPKTRIKSLEELLEHCEVDTDVWMVDRYTVNKWEVGAKDAEGEIQVEPLFQVKAWLKRNRVIADAKTEIARLKTDFKTFVAELRPAIPVEPPTRTKTLYEKPNEACLLEISIPDVHMGKRAWEEETGNDYDLDIAERIHDRALEDLLQKTSGYPISRICFVVGNDLLNADNLHNTTTKGTIQQVDGRYAHVYRTTRRMIVRAVERMTEIAEVDVVVVPGNHDRQSAFCLGDSLECWFHSHPLVKVDNMAALRSYYEFGANMLCFTHGSEERMQDLPLLMAAEQPAMWGRTKFREVHLGHWHKTKLDEFKGVRTRILPSLCGTDDWHAKSGYVGNIRSAEAFVWGLEDGLVGHHIFNLKGE